ncbi:MAG: prephenate dehydratase domain-containing protein, partial [Candidatus Bathyarchaeia archaeon]
MEIEELRKRIDQVDSEMLKLLKERSELASKILEAKKKLGLPFKDVKREMEILETVRTKAVDLALDPTLTEEIFKRIIGLSTSSYRDISIAYLGPKGSFTEIAARKFLNEANLQYLSKLTIREVFRSVEAGDVDMGVVPVENSIEGSVNVTLDLLLDTPLKIYGEVELRIDHCLLAGSGSTVEDIRVVFSHPQAIAQCRAFLETVIPQAEIVEVNSTSKAAEIVRNLRGAAAIASEYTASIYGLEVLAKSIQDYHDNYT